MNKNKILKQVVVVSTFSGLDLLLYGMLIAGMKGAYAVEYNKHAAQIHEFNFRGPDGTPLIRWVMVEQPEYDELMTSSGDEKKEKNRKKLLREQYLQLPDGGMKRPETVQDVDGRTIRKVCHQLYGENIWIVLLGGPPCQDFTKLNSSGNGERNQLVFEYLRILEELRPDVAVMEEVPDVLNGEHKELYFDFLARASRSGYRITYKVMNALLYDGCQSRKRCITMMVHEDMGKMPVFPRPMPESVRRLGEVLDVDHFFSGHYTDKIKTRDHFMSTVTSGSPLWLAKDGVKRSPSTEELLLFQGVNPEMGYRIPPGIPQDEIKKAIGNAVPVNLSYHLGKTIMEEIFELPAGENIELN